MANLEVRAFVSGYHDSVRLFVLEASHIIGNPRVFYPGPEEAGLAVQAGDEKPRFGELSMDAAQQLANDLWEAGLRPTQSNQSQGQFEAQGKHLQDMRAIAFAKLNVEAPNGKG